MKIGKQQVKVLAVLDTGSSSTIIDESFANKFKLPVVSGPVQKSFQYIDRSASYETKGVAVTLIGQDRNIQQMLVANTVKDFSKNCHLHDWSQELKNYEYMTNVIVPEYPYPPIGILLIGCDNPDLLKDLESKNGPPKHPIAIRTALGWGFMGPIRDNSNQEDHNYYQHDICLTSQVLKTKDDFYQELVKRSFELETFGLEEKENPYTKGFSGGPKDPSTWSPKEKAADDKLVIKHLKEENRFEASIPWKDNYEENLHSNFAAVKLRQDRSHTKEALAKKGVLIEEIDKIIEDYIAKNYIELVQQVKIHTC